MVKPYYQDEWVTIYHGDCREILPQLPKVDLVLTDPPYGINLQTDYKSRKRGLSQIDYLPVYGDDKPFDPSHLLALDIDIVIFGAIYFADKLPVSNGWLIWDKRDLFPPNDQADCELAWTNCVKGARLFRHRWSGYNRDSEREEHYHPTQKPVSLMRWCILQVDRWAGDKEMICDPYMGGGSVIRAAKDLNRKCIGVEIEEKYCEIAANRCRQMVFNFG